MKSTCNLFFCLTLLLCTKVSFSQNQLPAELPFDFLDFKTSQAAIEKYKFGKYGQTFVLKITNINKSIWTIADSTKQQSYNTEMPDIFKGIKLPAFLNLAIPPMPGQSLSAAPGGGSAPSLNDINSELGKINDAKDKLRYAIELNNEFKNLYADCQNSSTNIVNSAIAAVKSFVGTTTVNRAQQAVELRKNLKDNTDAATAALKALKQKVPLYVEAQQQVIVNASIGPIWEWNSIPPAKSDRNYVVNGKAAKKAELTNEAIKTQIAIIQSAVAKAEEIVSEIQKFSADNKIEELIANYNMINEANFTYYTEEFKIKEDEVSLNVTLTATKPLTCDLPSKYKISASYPTKGGFKVDFSTGIFGMAGGKDFQGREPYYKQIDSTTSSIKDKDGGKRVLLGVGALMHLYWRRGDSKMQYAISPGLSTTTNFDGINFHLGGSLIAGGKNRIVFTLGVVAKESKILDRTYQFDANYSKAGLPEAPPTIKVFPKWGGFLSLTYNWSKLKKQ